MDNFINREYFVIIILINNRLSRDIWNLTNLMGINDDFLREISSRLDDNCHFTPI
jgi:hypothetical protein